MLQVPGAPLQSPPRQSMAYTFLSTDSQGRIHQIVKSAVLPNTIHTKPYLTGREIIELTLEDTCSTATTKNQSIQISNIDHIKSQQDVIEKDYVLGWVLWGIGSDSVLSNTWILSTLTRSTAGVVLL